AARPPPPARPTVRGRRNHLPRTGDHGRAPSCRRKTVQDTEPAPLLDVISRAETLEQAVAAMPLAVVVVDRDGRVVLWSGAAEELYGWRAAEAVGRPARDLIVALGSRAPIEEIRATVGRGERWMGT